MRKSQTTEQFLIFGLLAFLILFIGSRGLSQPIRTTAEIPLVSLKSQAFKINSFFQYLSDWRTNEDQLIRLRVQISRLSSSSAQLASLMEENTALRKQLAVSLGQPQSFKEAKPTGLTAGQLTIDIGRRSNVAVGDNVVLGQVFVGQVIRTSDDQSVVLLPTSDASKISVVVRSTTTGVKKASGLLVGQGEQMILDKVSPSESLAVGDLVMTTGDGFVRDLVIGSIGQVIPTPGQLFQKALVDEVIDVSQLERVFIINNHP